MRPEPLDRVLARVQRRTWLAHLLVALAAALLVAAVLSQMALIVRLAASLAAAGVVLAFTARRRSRREAARLIERALPDARNLIITAQELSEHPERASPAVRARVAQDAERAAAALVSSRAQPLRVPLALFAVALLLLLGVTYVRSLPAPVTAVLRGTAAAAQRLATGRQPSLEVTVVPPRYMRLQPWSADDPAEIRAPEGSTATLLIRGAGSGARLRFGSRELPARRADGGIAADVRLTSSGYIAVETDQERRLVPVILAPDAAPAVKVDRPARDLLVPSADGRITVAASATDDVALTRLEVRYTKVSGSGEDFEFVEGTLPARLVRNGEQRWTVTADMSLRDLALEPGDALVYRAVAQDRRDGAGVEASSDTFFVEVAGPGQVALEGFDLPPEQERYALSQQMVVIKIERLRARERSLTRAALEGAAAGLAAEQRAVRAYFVFLMGGHVEDEEVEAEQSHEIQEGRLENTARREISSAIHLMTRAEQGLVAVNTGSALPPAKQAVEALQRAFGRNRYILRTPPARTEVDLARRLTGSLDDAQTWRRDRAQVAPDEVGMRAQAFVRDLLGIAARLHAGSRVEPAPVESLAEQALAIDPSSEEWRRACQELRSAAGALAVALEGSAGQERFDAVRAALGRALHPALRALDARSVNVPEEALRRSSPTTEAWNRENRR